MIKITFRNMESSELAREATEDRIQAIVEKFEHLQEGRILVTLEMENSPQQAGPDVFKVKVQVNGGRYKGVRIVKSAPSLYVALADVVDHLLESLNRFSDKARVTERVKARKMRAKVDHLLQTAS
jgi:ribosome-associated translation inhibitor RaiA